jgi:hypothetical protein
MQLTDTAERENHEDNTTPRPEQVEFAETKVDTGEQRSPDRVLQKGELHSPDSDADLQKKLGAKVVTIKGTTYLVGHVSNVPEIIRGVQTFDDIKELTVSIGGAFVDMGKEALQSFSASPYAVRDSMLAIGPALDCAVNYYSNTGLKQIAADIDTASGAIVDALVDKLGRPITPNEQGKYIASTAMYFMPGPGEGMVAAEKGEVEALALAKMSEKELKQANVGKIEISAETSGRLAGKAGESFAAKAASEEDLYRLVLSDRGFDNSIGIGRLESAARTRIGQLEPEVAKIAGKADSELTRAEMAAKSELNRLQDFVGGRGAESAEAQVARLRDRIPELKELKGKADVVPTHQEAADFIKKYQGEKEELEKKLVAPGLDAREAAKAEADIEKLRERIDALDMSKGNAVLTPKETQELIKSHTAQLKGLERKLPVSVVGAGGPMGLGFNTYAVVQIVLPDGRALAATGKYIGAEHAEQIAIARLEKLIAAEGGTLPKGSRIMVVGDREVCSEVCAPDLKAFAERIGADRVDGYTFRREKAVGNGMAGEKTTMRSMTQPSVQEKVQARTGIDPDVAVPRDVLWRPEHLGLKKQHLEVWRREPPPGP